MKQTYFISIFKLEPPTLSYDDSNVATPVYHSVQYDDGTVFGDQQCIPNNRNEVQQQQQQQQSNDKRVITNVAEISTSDFYSDQSQ